MSKFVWDDDKFESNLRKHGVSFVEAVTVFDDDEVQYYYDHSHSGNEDRFIALGMSRFSNLLVVCHCYRENDEYIRVISAREATKTEKKYYEEGVYNAEHN